MNDIIISFMNEWGYIAIILLITIENLFPPIPSELILTFAGFMTTYSSMNLILVIIFSTLGSLLGAIVLYFVGRFLNVNKLKKLNDYKIFRYLKIKNEDIDKASLWFNNKGEYTVFFCRFLPIVRSLISIPAGMNSMNFLKFVLFSFYGSVVWNSILCILGAYFGEAYPLIINFMSNFSIIFLFIIFIIISYFIFRYYRN